MKRGVIAIITAPLIMASLLTSGCVIITGTAINTGDANIATTPPKEKIKVKQTHVKAGEVIAFSGTTTLPNGTLLQSQLYEDDKPSAWWPADRDIRVQDGEWQITVPLGENGAPRELLRCADYAFKVWAKDNPSITGGAYFDLYGPPAILYSASDEATEGEITVNSGLSNMCNNTSFSGRTTLPDGTILRAQLYEDDKPVGWWPADKDIKVQDGQWGIIQHAEETGKTHDFLIGPTYAFVVWKKNDPSVKTTIRFDLVSRQRK